MGILNSRPKQALSGPPLEDHLTREGASRRCGRTVVDLKTGDLVHSVTVGGIVEDIYDILMLPGVQRPIALGSKTDDTRRVISI